MTKERIDGKKSNIKKDKTTVSAIKALFNKGTPAQLIAQLYNCSESSVYMLGLGARQAKVPPMSDYLAVKDINSRFQKIINSASTA